MSYVDKGAAIESLVRWRGEAGKRLPAISKFIAIALLGHARRDTGFTVVLTEADLCDELAMDAKTLRKYVQQLLDFGLVTVDRARQGGAKRYDCSSLVARFAAGGTSA